MTSNRILYTFEDVKKLIGRQHQQAPEAVEVYENRVLEFYTDDPLNHDYLEDHSFVFQITLPK